MQAAVTTTAKKLVDTLSMKPTPHKTGNLWRSMAYEVKLEGQIIRAQITAKGAPYWFWQNFGTRRIEAKHFVEKAIDKVQPDKMVAEEFYKLYKK
jgi:HK97 gp10 family phage protein